MVIKIPNEYVHGDSFELMVVRNLIRYRCVDNVYYGNIESFMHCSGIYNDSNNRNRRRILSFIESVGATIDGKSIELDVDLLYDINYKGMYSNFLMVDDSVDIKYDIFKYYCLLLMNINMYGGCFKQSYIQLSNKFNMNVKTLIKYNQYLFDNGYIYYGNTGNYFDEETKTVINSSNFYGVDKEVVNKELDKFKNITVGTFGWAENSTSVSKDIRKARGIVGYWKDKDLSNCSEKTIIKLDWAKNILDI